MLTSYACLAAATHARLQSRCEAVSKSVMSTVLLDTGDLGEAEEILSAAFGRLRIGSRPREGPARTRMRRTVVGSLSVDDLDFSYDMSLEMGPPEKITLCRIHSGAIAAQLPQQQPQSFRAGDVAAFGVVSGLPVTGGVYRARYDALSIEWSLLSEVAAGPPVCSVEPVRLTGSAPVSAGAGQYLADAIEYVIRGVATNPAAAQSPLVVGAVRRYVAASMLATFPNSALLEPTIEDRHDSTPVLLRRAMTFIDDNAHTDISVSEIAAAIYVTPRALQYMFRRHRDCTPMEYVRRVRLHHAHLDLVAGSRASITVAGIARRWGFGHIGRFALAYRQAYGQSPRVTLRN
jgi:AraC-like DNA-binding protein